MITYNEGLFHLKTKNASYVMGLYQGKLLHFYWGKTLSSLPTVRAFLPVDFLRVFSPADLKTQEGALSTGDLTMEYAEFGRGDVRTAAFCGKDASGTTVSDLRFVSYKIEDGKYALPGLPATYSETGDKVQTLKIELQDAYSKLKATLLYGVFEDCDAITRAVCFENGGEGRYTLDKAMSMSVDFGRGDFDFLHLSGSWARERKPQRSALINGTCQVESICGTSSHIHNPFFALLSSGANEEYGDVYGFNLVYSGNFIAGAQRDRYDNTRAFMGIHPTGFSWHLEPGESFYTPETVMVYSGNGLGQMSRNFHKLYRTRLCRGKYRDGSRPVLINNWEATYFDFNEEKILTIAKTAADLGVELMVLDDGWFGARNGESGSLGDWVPFEEKLPNGITGLAQKVNDLGMKFGLWFEPEMVSPDSDLYRAHTDWCLHQKGRERTLGRNQLVLDLTRSEVREYVKAELENILATAPITYVKWDMNRYITEIGSDEWDYDHQSEIAHRYVLGLYEIMEYLTKKYPDVLFEGCSGGGGRFDPGILHYMPQIWTSDDTDAVERIGIQYGTSICYPYSSMGAHVSAVPNHQVFRTTPMKLRGDVAICGQLGYELDLSKLCEEEKEEVRKQIADYKRLDTVFHEGDVYRLITPEHSDITVNQFISEDGKTVVLCTYVTRATPNDGFRYAKLQNLDANAVYTDEDGNEFRGDFLMHYGVRVSGNADYQSRITVFTKTETNSNGEK